MSNIVIKSDTLNVTQENKVILILMDLKHEINKDSKLVISCDRQIRPSLVAFSKDIPLNLTVGPILSKFPQKDLMSNLASTIAKQLNISPSSYYISFNGVKWARSEYLHMKIFVSPEEFVNKQLYPQWSSVPEEELLNHLKSRFDLKLFNYLVSLAWNIVNPIFKSSVKIVPDGRLHGFYVSKALNSDSLDQEILEFENFLFTNDFRGNYAVYILPFVHDGQTKYLLYSRVDEELFARKYVCSKIVKYEEPERCYYYQYEKLFWVTDNDLIFPTSKTLTKKKRKNNSRRGRNRPRRGKT